MHEHGPNGFVGPRKGTEVRRPGSRERDPSADTPLTPRRNARRTHLEETKDTSKQEPAIRYELVERIRREIADGTYDTPEKFQIALDRLLERLEQT